MNINPINFKGVYKINKKDERQAALAVVNAQTLSEIPVEIVRHTLSGDIFVLTRENAIKYNNENYGEKTSLMHFCRFELTKKQLREGEEKFFWFSGECNKKTDKIIDDGYKGEILSFNNGVAEIQIEDFEK